MLFAHRTVQAAYACLHLLLHMHVVLLHMHGAPTAEFKSTAPPAHVTDQLLNICNLANSHVRPMAGCCVRMH